jgi:hypothetical protein
VPLDVIGRAIKAMPAKRYIEHYESAMKPRATAARRTATSAKTAKSAKTARRTATKRG